MFLQNVLPKHWKETLYVRAFAFWKIPLLWYVRPSVLVLNEQQASIGLKLRRKTRNHVGAMYLAAMVAGADIASALMAMHQVRLAGEEVTPIFRDLSASFHKRAEGDVVFTCTQGPLVAEMVRMVLAKEERVTQEITVFAYVKQHEEPIAEFKLGLSLKKKKRA